MSTGNRERRHELQDNGDMLPSSSSSPPNEVFDQESNKGGGYVDRYGVPNPNYVSGADDRRYSRSRRNIGSAIARQRVRNRQRLDHCTDFFADLSFFFGATMYLWLAVSESHYEWMSNDGGSAAANEDNTIIIDGFSSMAYTMHGHYNNQDGNHDDPVWFLQDRIVFRVDWNDSDGNESDMASSVTLYMMYGFAAALLMFATGALKLLTTTSTTDRVPYVFMILAASFAMASSSLVYKHVFLSNVFFSVAIHFFALQAATLLLWRSTGSLEDDYVNLLWARIVADALFLIATLGGIALSYLFLFDATDRLQFAYEYLAIGASGFWWLASVVYLAQTFSTLVCQERPSSDEDAIYSWSGGEKGLRKPLPHNDTKSTNEEDDDEEDSQAEPHDPGPLSRRDVSSNQNNAVPKAKSNDEESVISFWTAGPGPSNMENVTKSSLDDIFGRLSSGPSNSILSSSMP